MTTRKPAGNYHHAQNNIASALTYCRAEQPAIELAMLTAARRELEALTAAAVRSARQDGISWQEIGARLGITKQAAQQRYTA